MSRLCATGRAIVAVIANWHVAGFLHQLRGQGRT